MSIGNNFFILTNNPHVKNVVELETSYDVCFIEGTVQQIISKCEELFLSGIYTLAADPLAGRRTRPFPYLTIILENKGVPADEYDWNRITQYATLNIKRISKTVSLNSRLDRDYQILDCSFAKAALGI